MVQYDTESRLNALVEKLLPASLVDVLFLAESVDAMAPNLEARGHGVLRLRWRDQTDHVQHPDRTARGLVQVNLAQPETAGRQFDLAVIADLTSEVHPLVLFEQLDLTLKADAIVVLVVREDSADQPRLVHWRDYVIAIGKRCGFVSAEPEPRSCLTGSNCWIRILRKSAPPRWRISHVMQQDFAEIARLFEEVFGHSLSRDLWNWKYAEGRGNAVVARRNGEIVAHYGGMYRKIRIYGKCDWAFQICDVMVHVRERGVLTRQGPFFLAATTCAEIYGPLGYGFPNHRAMMVAEKMGLYAKAGQMAEVRWAPAAPSLRLRTRVRSIGLQDGEADRALVDGLWAEMAADLRDKVVGVRDWAYLAQRYLCHPHHHYDVLLVTARFSGKPLGIAVLRRHEASCELLDVIGPLRNLAMVVDQARRMTGNWGLPYLYCWITRNHLPLFLACQGKEEALDICIPTSCWTSDARAEKMKGAWWLMAGDTDFH